MFKISLHAALVAVKTILCYFKVVIYKFSVSGIIKLVKITIKLYILKITYIYHVKLMLNNKKVK